MHDDTTLPHDFPGLREEAERLAREIFAVTEAQHGALAQRGNERPRADQERAVGAQAALLRDLTRPASRDWALRWAVEHAATADHRYIAGMEVTYWPATRPARIRAIVLAIAGRTP